jgi:DHA1 family inner membrane transport protein
MVAVTITATMISSYYVMFTFIAPIVEWRLGMGRDGVTIILFVLGVGAVLGNWLGGYLTNKIGPERTIMVIALTQLIFLPAATLYPFGLVDGAILFFIWSTITWGFIVPQQTRLIKAMPHAQNVILALNAACIYIGAAVGSAIGGTFYRIFGIEWLGPVGAVVAFLGALHLALSMRQFRIAERVTA